VQYARRLGVRIGNNNRLMACRHGMFGGEPYLIKIGSDCLISGEVQFLTHDGSASLFRKEFPHAFIYMPISIGNNVFIGYRCVILPGVSIGDNVAIGAGSVVTKDIPSNCIAAGVPAKVIRTYDEYKEIVLAKMDEIDGFNPLVKKAYLTEKHSLFLNR